MREKRERCNCRSSREFSNFNSLSISISGLAVPTVGGNSLLCAEGVVDRMVTVCEESIALSILRLLEMEKVTEIEHPI